MVGLPEAVGGVSCTWRSLRCRRGKRQAAGDTNIGRSLPSSRAGGRARLLAMWAEDREDGVLSVWGEFLPSSGEGEDLSRDGREGFNAGATLGMFGGDIGESGGCLDVSDGFGRSGVWCLRLYRFWSGSVRICYL